MAVTPQRARSLALGLENSTAYPHFDRQAFRTPRRTFATLALDGRDMNFMLDLAQQASFCALAPHALAPVAGGWGRMGATRCDLKQIDARTFVAVLSAAHARANTPPKKKARAVGGSSAGTTARPTKAVSVARAPASKKSPRPTRTSSRKSPSKKQPRD